MSLALTNTTVDKYFGFLTQLDNNSKKNLIIKLMKSIKIKKETAFDLASLYGAWEDSRSSDEIIKEIKSTRVDKDNFPNF